MGGWQLREQSRMTEAGTPHEVTYKFTRSFTLGPLTEVTVWSSDAPTREGETTAPPNNIVMGKQKWVAGESIRFVLLNNKGEACIYP